MYHVTSRTSTENDSPRIYTKSVRPCLCAYKLFLGAADSAAIIIDFQFDDLQQRCLYYSTLCYFPSMLEYFLHGNFLSELRLCERARALSLSRRGMHSSNMLKLGLTHLF